MIARMTLAFLLVLIAPAEAHFTPKNRTHNFRHVATAHWGPEVCGESPMTIPIIRATPETLPEVYQPKKDNWLGLAVRTSENRCITYIRDVYHTSQDLCSIIVHETGHHKDFKDPSNPSDEFHSSDPSNVMFAMVTVFAPCYPENVRSIASAL